MTYKNKLLSIIYYHMYANIHGLNHMGFWNKFLLRNPCTSTDSFHSYWCAEEDPQQPLSMLLGHGTGQKFYIYNLVCLWSKCSDIIHDVNIQIVIHA